jgi:glycosyltransferase EpsD
VRILFVASIDHHILRFHLPTIKWLNEIGCEVHVACSGSEPIPGCSVRHFIDFVRLPFAIRNIVSYFQLRRVIKRNTFKIVHCHTPAASIITRLVCNSFRKKQSLTVFYTAHGFHFSKDSPRHHWLIYYTLERLASRWVDCLITINKEDYELAKEKFYCKDVQIIPGMGADPGRFKRLSSEERKFYRDAENIPQEAFVLIYTAEFTKVKNQAQLIRALAYLKLKIPNLLVLLLGRGRLLEETKQLAEKLMVNDIVRFLGFRADVEIFMGISDISVSTSMREGLGLHIVESMMTGLPVVVSDNKGHREIVQDGNNGFLFDQVDTRRFCELVLRLYSEKHTCWEISRAAESSVNRFSIMNSLGSIMHIYNKYLK